MRDHQPDGRTTQTEQSEKHLRTGGTVFGSVSSKRLDDDDNDELI